MDNVNLYNLVMEALHHKVTVELKRRGKVYPIYSARLARNDELQVRVHDKAEDRRQWFALTPDDTVMVVYAYNPNH